MIASIFGHIEINYERGVICFYSSAIVQKAGYCPTLLRICGLGKIDFPLDGRQIDITIDENVIPEGVSISK